MAEGFVEIEGFRPLRRALRFADKDVRRRLGHANRYVGQQFISDWLHPKPTPAAVGRGRGAKPRPSTSKSAVTITVGGKHRDRSAPGSQWGRVATNRGPDGRFRTTPPRPDIRRSVDRHYDDIADAWMDAIGQALSPAFNDSEGFR